MGKKRSALSILGTLLKRGWPAWIAEKSFRFVRRKRATCPHCNTKLKIELSRKTTHKQRVYFAIAEIVKGYQVVRNFEMYSYHKAGRESRYFFQEILQNWIREDGKHEMVGRNHTSHILR